MAIIRKRGSQVQRGYLSTPTTFRFRGSWTPSTVYRRGDLIVTPGGSLRWCGVAHTSGSTFSVGTEFSVNSPWWGHVQPNGVFRGIYNLSTNSSGFGTSYAPGDLVVDPNTGELKRGLFADSAGNSWNPTKFDDLGLAPPFLQIDPGFQMYPAGVPDAKSAVQGLGFYPKTQRLLYPHVKPLLIFNTPADFTSITGATAVADPDPLSPLGNVQIPVSGSSGTIALKTLGSTVDISKMIVRLPVKVSNYGNGATTVGTLASPLSTGGPITAIPLDSTGLRVGVAPFQAVTVDDNAGHTQAFTISDWVSASAGNNVTQIPVNSQTPSFAFPAGSTIKFIGRGGIASIALQVSSDNFATHASQVYIYNTANPTVTHVADTAWDWAGGGPGSWVAVSGIANLADLTAINAVRIVAKGSNSANYVSVSRIDLIPNNGSGLGAGTGANPGDGRAKIVFVVDDWYIGHWTYVAALAIKYGFPITTASSGRIASSNSEINYPLATKLAAFHYWQYGHHYYLPLDGGDDQTKDGPAKDYYISRARHSLKTTGGYGHEIHFWHDDDAPSAANLPIIRKYCYAAVGYVLGDTELQTLPPVNPLYIRRWGAQQSDLTGGSIGTTSADLTGTVTNIPLVTGVGAGLTQSVAAGEVIMIGGTTFTVSTTTAAGTGVAALLVQSLNLDALTVASGTTVLNPGVAMKANVDRAVTNAGLQVFGWENITRISAQEATTSAQLSGTVTAIPITTGTGAGLGDTMNAGSTLIIGGVSFVVATTTAAGTGVASIPVNSVTLATAIPSGTAVLNPVTGHPEITNLFAYCDSQRANADVVTIQEALAHYTRPSA